MVGALQLRAVGECSGSRTPASPCRQDPAKARALGGGGQGAGGARRQAERTQVERFASEEDQRLGASAGREQRGSQALGRGCGWWWGPLAGPLFESRVMGPRGGPEVGVPADDQGKVPAASPPAEMTPQEVPTATCSRAVGASAGVRPPGRGPRGELRQGPGGPAAEPARGPQSWGLGGGFGLEFKELAWPLPAHTLTSSPTSCQEAPYSGTHIQRPVSPPLMPQGSLSPFCCPGPGQKMSAPLSWRPVQPHPQEGTDKPTRADRVPEHFYSGQQSRSRHLGRLMPAVGRAGGPGRALVGGPGSSPPAQGTDCQVWRSKAAGGLLHACRKAQRTSAGGAGPGRRGRPPACSWRGAAKQSVNPRGEGPPGGAERASSRWASSRGEQTRGQGRQAAELRWWKHEAVGGFPGTAIILGSERRAEQTAADLKCF